MRRKTTTPGGKRVGYIRVSTYDQNTERQLDGVAVDKVFTDTASGKDRRRPQLEAALAYVREGDTLVVHSMDRLARNVADMLRMVDELVENGVRVEFVKERLTFNGRDQPIDRLMLTMLGAFAEFERSLIRERQREGIALAKARGVYTGRRRVLSSEQMAQLGDMIKAGHTKAAVARHFGISRESVYAYIRQFRDHLLEAAA